MLTWELSLDALAARGLPQARALLRLLSCYAPARPIPLQLIDPGLADRLLRWPGDPAPAPCLDQLLRGLTHLGLIGNTDLPHPSVTEGAETPITKKASPHASRRAVLPTCWNLAPAIRPNCWCGTLPSLSQPT